MRTLALDHKQGLQAVSTSFASTMLEDLVAVVIVIARTLSTKPSLRRCLKGKLYQEDILLSVSSVIWSRVSATRTAVNGHASARRTEKIVC